jgi:hypothetical protein
MIYFVTVTSYALKMFIGFAPGHLGLIPIDCQSIFSSESPQRQHGINVIKLFYHSIDALAK